MAADTAPKRDRVRLQVTVPNSLDPVLSVDSDIRLGAIDIFAEWLRWKEQDLQLFTVTID